jgi:transposase, IS5 family
MGDRQMSLGEAFLDPRMGLRGRLSQLSCVIAWGPLEAVAARVHPCESGRPPFAALAMLKAMYLQALYDLSDPGLEEALIDRVSFRLFCGFSLDQRTPDETTLCRFRNAAAKAGVLAEAFAEVNRQLEAKGLVIKKGTLVDATIVSAASARPATGGGAARVAREPLASFTRKGGKSYFGYRLHVGVDEGSGLVRRLALTPAHVNESLVADTLISGDEGAVGACPRAGRRPDPGADKGYESKKRRRGLKARGCKDRIMHRSHKNQAGLPYWQSRRNALIASRRAPVEAVFGTLKRVHGRARARFTSFAANVADFLRQATVYNLRRAAALLAK